MQILNRSEERLEGGMPRAASLEEGEDMMEQVLWVITLDVFLWIR